MTRLIVLLCVASFSSQVKADLVLIPRDTEAVIGDSTYFDCASNVNTNDVTWYHYAVAARDHEDTCLYCLGRVHPKHEQRIQVEKNFSSGNYRLMIKSVQRQDAGRYICQDNGGIGESSFAELVILESSPTCTSNMKPDGVLGPNDCGLEPDTLQLSCHVSYHGNIPPDIKWRKSEARDPINSTFCHNTDNRITCKLSITAHPGLNGVSYICETNRSTATTQFNCLSDIIRVIYVKSKNSTKKMVHGTEEKIFCSVNSSQSCIDNWKWFDGVNEEIVSDGSALVTQKPGWYKCESECNIRGKQCTVLSKLVHVSEPQTGSMPIKVIAGTSFMIAILAGLLCAGLICIVFPRNRRPTRSEESMTLIDAEEQTKCVSMVTTKAARERGLLIRGITILGKELFVLTQKCSEVEIFDCNTLVLVRQWFLKELIRPSDIASCKASRCLYIMDWKGDSVKKEVLRVDINGKLLRNWETGYDYGDLISVSNEQNIIVTCYGKSEINEYSPDGTMIRKVCLLNMAFPTHAVKLTSGHFIVGVGDISHVLHSVCMVDVDGKVEKSFGKERGSDLNHMDHPIHLNVYEDGSVAVLDNGNRRVLLLDKDLKLNRVLHSHKMNDLQNPTRILIDESSGRLFVAGIRNGIGEILVFQLDQFA